jgi:hypothetical protein
LHACLLNASKRYQKGISLQEMMIRIEYEKPVFVIQGTVQQHERLKVTLTKLNLKLTTICPLDD